MAVAEDKYKVVRLQILDEFTGEPLDYVNVRTNAKSVNLSDGTFVEDVIKSLTTRVNELQVTATKQKLLIENHIDNDGIHVIKNKIDNAITGVEFNELTGVLKFSRYDGTSIEWDTALEKIALDIQFDKTTNEIIFTMINGSEVRVDVKKLADIYGGTTTDTTKTSVSPENKISVDINSDAIKIQHLAKEVRDMLSGSEDFIGEYKDLLDSIEEGANNYTLPVATDTTLGGIIVGENMMIQDGTISAANIRFGDSIDTSTPVNIFMEVQSIGGPSTDPIPTMENATSYITSEGHIINYIVETMNYTYINTTGNTTTPGLTKAQVEKRFFNGLELVKRTDITWYHDTEYNYAVTASGIGFCYELEAWLFIRYIDTQDFIALVNSGTLQDGKHPSLVG